MKKLTKCFMALFAMLGVCIPSYASEASLVVPNIKESPFDYNLLLVGIVIALLGVVFGLIEFLKIKKIQVHPIMESVGNTIFETCKTYLVQQGKFLIILEVIIGICIAYYFGVLEHMGDSEEQSVTDINSAYYYLDLVKGDEEKTERLKKHFSADVINKLEEASRPLERGSASRRRVKEKANNEPVDKEKEKVQLSMVKE